MRTVRSGLVRLSKICLLGSRVALALLLTVLASPPWAKAEPPAPAPNFSGWGGGIGITFGTPSRDIPDVTELGYDMVWGGEDPRAIKALGISVFRYWNSIVETSLKGAGYDFSQLPDKEEAARLAFDAWMERTYGVKGLSKYAQVRYHPQGAYGDVYGSMDLSSENELVQAVIARYLAGFKKDEITHGGIGLDNAGKVPQAFLETLARRLNAHGLGIAANGCPDEYLAYIDFFGNEGFPFSLDYARQMRAKGLRGILGEFTMQHLSSGELDAYLKNKLFNGIVFFGYTNGGTAAGARYSAYHSRPDVYHHQRWVFRKLTPVSRALVSAGRQTIPGATLDAPVASGGQTEVKPTGVAVNAVGQVKELRGAAAGLDRITGRNAATPPRVSRYGRDAADGIFLHIDSGSAERVACDARQLGLPDNTLVFDEFAERTLPARQTADTLSFETISGPSVVQLGSADAIVQARLRRIADLLNWQVVQRALDREFGVRATRKPWATFCQAGKWDGAMARTGAGSLNLAGGTYTGPMPRWKYYNRQGAAQFVSLDQTVAQPIRASCYSKARDIPAVETPKLDSPAARRQHFDAREGNTYCLHLYVDYQDGQWPEVHTVSFSSGTHDWEQKQILVNPDRPVKTAMVLVEFHQPQGEAWFDDVELCSENEPDRNLLAAPGFEDQDPVAAEAQAISEDYENRVRALLDAVTTAAKDAPPAATLGALSRQAADLREWVTLKNLAPYFSRELRDLADSQAKLTLCQQLVAASAPNGP